MACSLPEAPSDFSNSLALGPSDKGPKQIPGKYSLHRKEDSGTGFQGLWGRWINDLDRLSYPELVCVCMCVCESLSHIPFFVTPWTVACQAPLSMGFSRQEYRSG